MRIIKLEASNFKRINAVAIEPDGNVVMITGRNGEGKTSVLDAIWAALSNPRYSEIPKPIKEGEEKAIITLDLEKYIVRRTFTEAGTRLTVTGLEGAEFKSPQKLLDKLLGSLTFDPLSFIGMKEKEQVDMILQLSSTDFDFQGNAEARQGFYDKRTEENRAVTAIGAAIGDEPEKITKIDISELQRQMEVSSKLRRDILEQEDKKSRIAERIAELIKDQDAINSYLIEAKKTIATYKPYDELKADVDKAIEHNSKAGEWDIWNNSRKSLDVHVEQANIYGNKIKEIDAQKKAALEKFEFPYEGLSFDDVGVTYNGIPIKQISKAEQIRVSMAIAMAMNPELRVIRIEDGSLLDSTNLKLIAELAEKNDYQVWIEAVDETGEVGIYIEDGNVK